jgi:gustatory receptor
MYVDTLIEWIVVIQFMNVVILLKNRFSLLNTSLSNSSGIFETENAMQGFHLPLYQRTSTGNVKEIKSQLTRKDVLAFNNTHDILIDAVLLVKSTYEVQILFSLLSTFVGITIQSYFFLCGICFYSVGNSKGVSVSSQLLSHTLWCSMHIARLLCVTIPCHSANNNMAHTSTVLRKLLLTFHTDPATMSELERFSHHVALRKCKFTVFGFLSLDLSLLVSMMGAVATYLVILMQFKINTN